MKNKMEIKKGQKYKTKSKGDFHSGTNLIVISITGQNSDNLVYLEAENQKKDNRIKEHKRYNKFSCRVWWIRDYCELVEDKN